MFSDDSLSAENDAAAQYYAWKFMKYITNAQVNAELCINGSEGYIPVRYSAYETAIYQQFLREGEILADTAKILLNEIDGNYYNTDVFIGSAQLRDQVGGIVTQVLNGTKTVTQAFNDAIDFVKPLIK